MKKLILMMAVVAGLAFSGCEDGDGPKVVREVSRMNHFMRVDVSNDLQAIADITCECVDIYGQKVEHEIFGTSTLLVDNTWNPNSGTEEPKQVTMTIKATPRGDSDTTSSIFVLETSIQTEFTIYDQNNTIMGYNGFEKSMSKKVEAGTNIKSFLESNFPVTYSFVITKGDDGTYGVQVQ